METLIVWTVVGAAAFWFGRRLLKKPRPQARAGTCGTSCAGCSCSGSGPEGRLVRIRTAPRGH